MKDRLIELLNQVGDNVMQLKTDNFIDSLADYLLANGVIVPPVKVGQTVFVICNCEDIPKKLDGTLWDDVGCYGTATGYYCPFEDICEAEECRNTDKIFETAITDIWYGECTDGEIEVFADRLKSYSFSDFGKTVFLTRKEAERALQEKQKE